MSKSKSDLNKSEFFPSPNQAELPLGTEATIKPAANDNTDPPKRVYGWSAIGTMDEYGPEIAPTPAPAKSEPSGLRPPLTSFSRLPTSAPFKNKPKPAPRQLYRPRNRSI